MQEILTQILYLSLTSIVPSTVAIMVPLVGAFWIFKVRERTVAEGKLFELGREIANIIQSKEIRGPIDGISYSYIDEAQYEVKEKKREKAIKQILHKYLHARRFEGNLSEKEGIEAANIVVAVATERIQSLVPPTINWTGKGVMYSPYGERIETKDSFFPFGTKLYRQWIVEFGDIYNDLWAITTMRRFFLASFLKQYNDGAGAVTEKFVNAWLDEIYKRIEEIHKIHAKLLTQLQIIDTQVDLPRLGKDVSLLAFYGCLLSFAGYFMPRLIHAADISSLGSVLWLSLASVLAYCVIGLRVIAAVQPVKEKNAHRTIFMRRLASELKDLERPCMRYKPHAINNILSMDSDLKLPKVLVRMLLSLVDKIAQFNEYAIILFKEAEVFLEPLRKDFATIDKNQQQFCIDLLALADEDHDLEQIKSRIMIEDCNFAFNYEEMHSSRALITINLSELDKATRVDLCSRLDSLRKSLQNLGSYSLLVSALKELQECRSTAQSLVQNMYTKSNTNDALTQAYS